MTVIPAFETHKHSLPEMIFVRDEREEDFSDYMREAIDRARDAEPESRSVADSDRDRDHGHHRDSGHGHDHDREREHDRRHAAAERRRDEAGNDVTEPERRTPAATESAAPNEDAPAATGAETAPTDARKPSETKDSDSGTDMASAGDAKPRAVESEAGKPTMVQAGVAAAQAATDSKAAASGKPTGPAPDAKITAAKAPAAVANQQPATTTGDTKPHPQPTPQASVQAQASANAVSAVGQLAAAADETVADPRSTRGKDAAPGQQIGPAKKQVAAPNGASVKPDTDPNPQGNGQGNSKAGSQAQTPAQAQTGPTAAAAATAPKTAAPAFTAMLATGADGLAHPGGTGDPMQTASLTQAGTAGDPASAALKAATQKTAPSGHTPASDQVAVRIASAIRQGVDRISIQLEPQDLGRVDVKLELAGDGRVTATVSADRQDTLDLLQRDSRALERALQQAGLKADSDSLNFNLRGDGQDKQQAGDGAPSGRSRDTADIDDDILADPALYRTLNSTSALDIRV